MQSESTLSTVEMCELFNELEVVPMSITERMEIESFFVAQLGPRYDPRKGSLKAFFLGVGRITRLAEARKSVRRARIICDIGRSRGLGTINETSSH